MFFSLPFPFIFSSVPFLLTYLSCSPSQVECTVQWLSMYHKTIQKKIMERVVKKEEEEKDAKVEEDQEETPEPTVPAPTMSAECQTDESFLSDEKVGSSSQK